ncbi:MAG: hypothetical protein FJ125_03705 [Deltaproteobacteria bacterium]|nr:hypothetical protein [Deltaproteobacteria bacterium]
MFRITEQRLSSFVFLEGLTLLPETHTVVRLSSPNLQAVISGKLGYEYPFDPRLGKQLVKTASQLMAENASVPFVFVGRTEISMLFEQDTHRNRRSPWTLIGGTAGLASARLSLLLGEAVIFQAAIYQLPTTELVEEYFAWQQASTRLSALTEHYVQTLRQRGVELGSARQMIEEIGPDDIGKTLEENGVDVEQIPTWQKDGTGLYRQQDGIGGTPLLVDVKLPNGDDFRRFLQRFLQ